MVRVEPSSNRIAVLRTTPPTSSESAAVAQGAVLATSQSVTREVPSSLVTAWLSGAPDLVRRVTVVDQASLRSWSLSFTIRAPSSITVTLRSNRPLALTKLVIDVQSCRPLASQSAKEEVLSSLRM